MLKDVLPTVTKLSVFFHKDNVGLASVESMVKSTIATIRTLRNDLHGELANLPSLKDLNQQELTIGLYCEKELQQAGAYARQVFINAGQAFLVNLIENLQERFLFPSDTLDICKALDLVVNPQSLPQSAADIAAHGVDALNKLIEHYGQQKTVVDIRNVNP